MNWFGRKGSPETAPDGSAILRYPEKDWAGPRLGFSDASTAGFTEAREQVYTKLFGEARSVSHELVPQVPHVDVYTFARRAKDGGEVCALVTGGMSDEPMRMPRGADVPKRVELIFYCSEPRDEYVDTLRWLAHFPHNQKTWIGIGHTIPNGNPPEPMWGSSILDTVLLMPTVVQRDQALAEELQLAGDPVHFLWVVPLTTAECNFKLKQGLPAIYSLFDKHRHPHVYDPHRASYV
jgi:hypothetical protein